MKPSDIILATYALSAPAPIPEIDTYPRRKRYGKDVPVRTDPKIGRNKPCPCGSGVKYKKCCAKK